MGTRADFYIKEADKLEWIGSIAYDGYPSGIYKNVLKSKNKKQFIKNVKKFLGDFDHATLPEMEWPWPWLDSRTTDYSYIFDAGKVLASSFGHSLFDPLKGEPNWSDEGDKFDIFPNMKDVQNINFGERSGLLFIRS